MRTRIRPFRLAQMFIAWFLIGLMTGGALVHYLSAGEPSNVCLEERSLESEDGRCDLWDELYIAPELHELFTQRVLWVVDATRHDLRYGFAIRQSHLERGPPVVLA